MIERISSDTLPIKELNIKEKWRLHRNKGELTCGLQEAKLFKRLNPFQEANLTSRALFYKLLEACTESWQCCLLLTWWRFKFDWLPLTCPAIRGGEGTAKYQLLLSEHMVMSSVHRCPSVVVIPSKEGYTQVAAEKCKEHFGTDFQVEPLAAGFADLVQANGYNVILLQGGPFSPSARLLSSCASVIVLVGPFDQKVAETHGKEQQHRIWWNDVQDFTEAPGFGWEVGLSNWEALVRHAAPIDIPKWKRALESAGDGRLVMDLALLDFSLLCEGVLEKEFPLYTDTEDPKADPCAHLEEEFLKNGGSNCFLMQASV